MRGGVGNPYSAYVTVYVIVAVIVMLALIGLDLAGVIHGTR